MSAYTPFFSFLRLIYAQNRERQIRKTAVYPLLKVISLDEGCEFVGFHGVIDGCAVHDLVPYSVDSVSIVHAHQIRSELTSVDPGNCPS